MAQEQESEKQTPLVQLLRPVSSIRGKIVLPYLILTLVVAIIGIYVVTKLVAGSLDERLTNQVLDAGRSVSDSMVRREEDHIVSAKAIAYIDGVSNALQTGDKNGLLELVKPTASNQGIDTLIIFDARGEEALHLLKQNDDFLVPAGEQTDISQMWIAQDLLASGDPNALPKRSLGIDRADGRYYYFTALPVIQNDQVVGVVVVGTSLDTLLPYLRESALANVIIYTGGDEISIIGATFESGGQSAQKALARAFSISPELYAKITAEPNFTLLKNVEFNNHSYRLAWAPLRVGNDGLGVFAVALPTNFILQAGSASRNTYMLIFAVATVFVVVLGYLISQRIIAPIIQLVQASRAVAAGRLDQRTGIARTDEIGMLATTFDEMTSRLETRTQELEETLGRMRAILASIGDGVLLEHLDGSFESLNTAAEKLLAEISENFMLGPLREPPSGSYDEEEKTKTNPWLLERRQIEVGQKVIRAHSAAVRAEDGELLGTVIVLRDVTSEVEAEQLKDAFVTHVSHELRTPLTAIKGYSELLLANSAGALNESQRGFLETINRHTDNLVNMINSLLDFSEMEAGGRLGLRRYPISLAELVTEIADEWRPRMDEKEMAFGVQIAPDLPLVHADTRRLRWAIINLVRNAWQYTPPEGSVKLELSGDGDRVILDVVDTGAGIPPQDQEKVFSRFYNVTRARYKQEDDDVRGLGLGLYVSQAIVKAHGGEITLTSQVGVGSKFRITLPALPHGNSGAA